MFARWAPAIEGLEDEMGELEGYDEEERNATAEPVECDSTHFVGDKKGLWLRLRSEKGDVECSGRPSKVLGRYAV